MPTAKKGRILTGDRPTGRLHIGHYLGKLKTCVSLQDEYECFFEIADWHALTTAYEDTAALANDRLEVAIDWLASGYDPERSVLFVQSDVKEHAELHVLLSMIVPVSWLERCPTYKEQIRELNLGETVGYGLLGYPVLQAADIIVYRADTVPVGKDQLPHLELSREIARRFNSLYGPVLPEPRAVLSEFSSVPGTDGRKMSKSYGNTIDLADPPGVVAQKVRGMFTDPEKLRMGDPGHPDGCPVFMYHGAFNPDRLAEIKATCESGELGCVPCKKELTERLLAYLEPLHERRAELARNPDYVRRVLAEGAEKARAVAAETLVDVRRAMKL